MISKQPRPVGRNAHPNLSGSRVASVTGLEAARLVHGMLRRAERVPAAARDRGNR